MNEIVLLRLIFLFVMFLSQSFLRESRNETGLEQFSFAA
jgi:hypothetical protein